MMDEQGTRFEVLLEDMGRNASALADAIAAQAADSKALKSNLERLDSRFGEITFEMRELTKTVAQVATKVDRLDAFATDAAPRLERLEGKVDRLEGKVDRLEGKVDRLEGKVDRLEGKVDRLEGKVDKLEGKVDRLEGKVDKLEAFASDAGPRLVRLEAFATDAAPQLERLEAFTLGAAPRLVRIETHLALPAVSPRKEMTRPRPSKHHRKKPAKRN
jgi:phage shock protein A